MDRRVLAVSIRRSSRRNTTTVSSWTCAPPMLCFFLSMSEALRLTRSWSLYLSVAVVTSVSFDSVKLAVKQDLWHSFVRHARHHQNVISADSTVVVQAGLLFRHSLVETVRHGRTSHLTAVLQERQRTLKWT